MSGTVLILGATSPIARGVAEAFARRGHPLCLAARSLEEAERLARDLELRFGIETGARAFEAEAVETHRDLLEAVDACRDGLGGVVLAFGALGDAEEAARDFEAAAHLIDVNYRGAVSVLTHAAELLEQKGHGFLAVLSSVAGDRGRKSNYVYGSAKAGLTAYTQGLRGRLHPAGVRVLTVKPGFVDTAMTFGKPGVFAVADPRRVGEGIVRALERGEDVVYLPRFWRGIMTVLRHVPEVIFKRLDL
ncbi:MAG: SDR family oxidoreductase [Deltaproteobacteria bacterium]|nr:SDR family oxidoreductase [Deltaproteobacteria bacterium]